MGFGKRIKTNLQDNRMVSKSANIHNGTNTPNELDPTVNVGRFSIDLSDGAQCGKEVPNSYEVIRDTNLIDCQCDYGRYINPTIGKCEPDNDQCVPHTTLTIPVGTPTTGTIVVFNDGSLIQNVRIGDIMTGDEVEGENVTVTRVDLVEGDVYVTIYQTLSPKSTVHFTTPWVGPCGGYNK